MWKEMAQKMGVKIDDPLLEQSVYQEMFEICVRDYFSTTSTSVPTTTTDSFTNISADELNVMRYVSGYVARSLLRRYEARTGDVYSQYVTCLGEMAVEGEGEDLLTYTKKWIEQINRGGLFPINDETFHLFIEIEKSVREYLPKYLCKYSTNDRTFFTKNVHDKVIEQDDVQFHWTLLSQDIDSPERSQILLGEVFKLWVTIRGFSMVASWVEMYKITEKTNTQKSTGLRKSLSGLNH
ncbi:hypothetical protein SPONN_1264 [uncultured Candidatus Thioglobus sp.]|nr:hypothetical protein SPONN_1264 [uncultured Candidatus Thioglobus sp.]